MAVQLATRVDETQARIFKETTRKLGTTPADAMRMFICSFNAHQGFPYDVRLSSPVVEAFESEGEAAEFAEYLAQEMINDAR